MLALAQLAHSQNVFFALLYTTFDTKAIVDVKICLILRDKNDFLVWDIVVMVCVCVCVCARACVNCATIANHCHQCLSLED